ncbi:hypothetical protein [Hungatella hathewayi]|uniref:hypothetical protein n=1 Tax=Hungatella hathewayi TaxID=154046 RepID=UPI003567E88D
MTLLDRIKIAFNNEEGSLILEQVVIIGVLLLISSVLILLVFRFQEINKVKSGFTTTTGWFRTENTQGMKN